jgi:hypothetical protein
VDTPPPVWALLSPTHVSKQPTAEQRRAALCDQIDMALQARVEPVMQAYRQQSELRVSQAAGQGLHERAAAGGERIERLADLPGQG